MKFKTTMERELNIIPPIGYEVDRQKSTFEKIIFKKIPENPKTWEDYCSLTKGKTARQTNYDNYIIIDRFSGAHYQFSTKKRAEQFIALGKLLQLRDYWVGDWKWTEILDGKIYAVYNNIIKIPIVNSVYGNNFPLTFPTREMAQEFIECFKDLVKEAYPLV